MFKVPSALYEFVSSKDSFKQVIQKLPKKRYAQVNTTFIAETNGRHWCNTNCMGQNMYKESMCEKIIK